MTTRENRPAEDRAAQTTDTVTGKDSALRLHELGLHVFPADHPKQPDCIGKHGPETPCNGDRGKHPAVKWSVWAIAPTRQMIEAQWDKYDGRANIGIACGPSNLVVFDEDAPDEVDRWCADNGVTLPDTYEVTTGKGRHLYFRWDHTAQRIGNVPKAVRDYKIDIRGHGGFVVAEGSRHESGDLYSGNGAEIAGLSPEVADVLLTAATRETGQTEHTAIPAEGERFDPNAEIPYGQRDTELTRYAGRLRKSGLDIAEVEAAFRDRWLCCQQPVGQIPEARFHSAECPDPFTWDQALAKLRNVFNRYPADVEGKPVPLTRRVSIPPFPVNALPTPVADMVAAVAEAMQVDPAMAGTAALSALSACTGGHAEIEVRPGWREPLCLYTATIASPGERKSAVQQAMTRPILDVEGRLTETMMPTRQETEAKKQIAERKAEKARNDAATPHTSFDENKKKVPDPAADAEAENTAIEAVRKAAEIEVPPIPRLVADDVTPEAAASLLAEQKGRLAVISAEGGVFDIIAGRYNGNVPNLDLWLKGHSGDMIRIDRKGRAPEYIPRPAMTLGLMIQPDVLTTIAAQRVFRGRGLLARFLYALPVSKVGHRRTAASPMPDEVVGAYNAHVDGLASTLAGWAGDPGVLTLAPDAREALERIEAEVEPMLAEDGELGALRDWGSKLVGAIARIAGILHLAAHDSDAGVTEPVNADTIHAAYRVGCYFKAAAINAFSEMASDPTTSDAVYLLGRIGKITSTGDDLSARDMHVATKSRFTKKEALMAAVTILVDHGYLVPLKTDRKTGGRPASPRYRFRGEG